jgi:hypothetical protein
MMDPLLAIMAPREITEAVDAFRRLPIRRAWLERYTEWELVDVLRSIVDDDAIPFTHMLLCADDVVVTPEALAAVLDLAAAGHPVVTGWCRLDATHPLANITDGQVGHRPARPANDWRTTVGRDGGRCLALETRRPAGWRAVRGARGGGGYACGWLARITGAMLYEPSGIAYSTPSLTFTPTRLVSHPVSIVIKRAVRLITVYRNTVSQSQLLRTA